MKKKMKFDDQYDFCKKNSDFVRPQRFFTFRIFIKWHQKIVIAVFFFLFDFKRFSKNDLRSCRSWLYVHRIKDIRKEWTRVNIHCGRFWYLHILFKSIKKGTNNHKNYKNGTTFFLFFYSYYFIFYLKKTFKLNELLGFTYFHHVFYHVYLFGKSMDTE